MFIFLRVSDQGTRQVRASTTCKSNLPLCFRRSQGHCWHCSCAPHSCLWLSPGARSQSFVDRGAKPIRPDTLWDPILQTLQFCEETARIYGIPLRLYKPEVKMEVCLGPSAMYLSLNFPPIFSNNQIFCLFWV